MASSGTVRCRRGGSINEFVVIPHGKQPRGESYAVVYLPGWTETETEAWLEGGPVTILQQNGEAHVVQHGEAGKVLAVRWG